MSDLNLALDNSLKERVVFDFYAIKISLPGATIRLIDGAGVVNFDTGAGTEKFTGRDAIFGVLDSTEAFGDGFGDQAPELVFTIQPATDGAVLALTSQANQLSPVEIWYGTRDQENTIIGVSKRFDGFFDFATIEGEQDGSINIDINCITWQALYWRIAEGVGLSDASHQSFYPGELGLAYVTGIQRSIIWGPGDRPSNVIYSGGGGFGGGSSGGAGGDRAIGRNLDFV